MQQCVKPLGDDVTELLVRCPARVGERIVRQLLGERSGGRKALFGGVAVEEQPILVVQVGEEVERHPAVHREHGPADEDPLLFADLPSRMTHDGVVGVILDRHPRRPVAVARRAEQ